MTATETEQPHCLVEQHGGVLVVTMNRPSAKNALSGEMIKIMIEAWDRVDHDPSIRACVPCPLRLASSRCLATC